VPWAASSRQKPARLAARARPWSQTMQRFVALPVHGSIAGSSPESGHAFPFSFGDTAVEGEGCRTLDTSSYFILSLSTSEVASYSSRVLVVLRSIQVSLYCVEYPSSVTV
jgi:hypothetical protein